MPKRSRDDEDIIPTAERLTDAAYPNDITAILGTALVRLGTAETESNIARAICDTGSQINLITESLVQLCGFRRIKGVIFIQGLESGKTTTSSNSWIEANLQHYLNEAISIPIKLHVVKTIANRIPSHPIDDSIFNQINNDLADPSLGIPAKVDVLLGINVWSAIVQEGIKIYETKQLRLTAQLTRLGWIVFGGEKLATIAPQPLSLMITNDQLDESIQKLWELEKFPDQQCLTHEENYVEDNFLKTHGRDPTGRYVVELPLKQNAPRLGDSRYIAIRRLLQMEKRITSEVRMKYNEFINDFITAGHMIPIVHKDHEDSEIYYIPHHMINKKKFRVVFDASCRTSNNISLNEIQLPGAKLQENLLDILLKFRGYKYAITADIVKMFRQVRIARKHWNYQRVVWRESPDHPITEYYITVIVWGMTSTTFNAVRALQQCAIDNSIQYPIVARAVLEDFYIDDFLSGASNEQDLLILVKQVTELLKSGGFQLDKWASNHIDFAEHDIIKKEHEIPFETGVLGLVWLPQTDDFRIKVAKDYSRLYTEATKRDIVSNISKIYDPSGLVAPVVITGRIIIQDVWRLKIDWDENIDKVLLQRYNEYLVNISHLDKIAIPRWINVEPQSAYEWNIFADASAKAFGAVAYLKVVAITGQINVAIVTSKARVAPVKQITIPRLELAASKLACEFYEYLIKVYKFPATVRFWTDSTIVLHWIRREVHSLKPFVANRVLYIQTNTNVGSWSHVRGDENPADLLTRGVTALHLKESKLWWHGPEWLAKDADNTLSNNTIRMLSVDEQRIINDEERETKRIALSLTPITSDKYFSITNKDGVFETIPERTSTIYNALRITAYVLRFTNAMLKCLKKHRCSNNIMVHDMHKPKRKYPTNSRVKGKVPIALVSLEERENALIYWLKAAQETYFPAEILACKQGRLLPASSQLRFLSPFIDSNGLMRIKGRLANADLPVEAKNQIIVPTKSRIAYLLRRNAHFRTLHGQTQLTTVYIRHNYWMPRLRQAVRSDISRCVTCLRFKRQTAQQQMADLPAFRVNKCEPFAFTGIDFAGPFMLSKNPGRPTRSANTTQIKAWIVVFICLTTKAIHLDIVKGLTIELFLEAFVRFTSRKGQCKQLWTDNGTTFVGADKELQRVLSKWIGGSIIPKLADLGTVWNFITPAAPHQGGIWEAGVKSLKQHLKRVVGKRSLTTEQLYTIVVQIEGCLNSRPLCPITDDPNDLEPLTPAHFLIGRSIQQAPISEYVFEQLDNRLNRFGQQQKLIQSFWIRWKEEYLVTLQKRNKWYKIEENIKIGDMVIIKQENLPPSLWPLGRVIEVRTAKDGLIRAVTIKTTNGVLKRPIQKLCILPFNCNMDTQISK